MSVGSAEGEACALGKCIRNAINGEGEGKGDIVHEGVSKPNLCGQSSSAMGRFMLEEMKMLFGCRGMVTCMGFFPLSASGNENGPLKPSAGNSNSNAYEKDEAIILLLFC